MSDLRWLGDPPPSRTGTVSRRLPADRLLYSDEAQELHDRPGEWAVLATFPDSDRSGVLAGRIRAGAYPALAGCETVSRKVGDEYRVYVRYVKPRS